MEVTTKPLSSFMFSHLQRRASAFQYNLTLDGRRRRNRCIPFCALQQPTMSPFQFLFCSWNDEALITPTGFDHKAFLYPLGPFQKYYKLYTPYNQVGTVQILRWRDCVRLRSLNPTQCLGLFLMRHKARGEMMTTSLTFVITASVAYVFEGFTKRLIYGVLTLDQKQLHGSLLMSQ